MKKSRVIAGLIALAAFGAACSSKTTTVSPASSDVTRSPSTGTAATNSGAASLRAALTSLLQEHVFLAGIAINTAVTTGLSSASTKAAVQTLDVNTVNLSNAIDSVYAGAGKTFLPLWRKHIGFFVSYTVAGAKGDKAGQAKAKTALDGYRADFGAFLAAANPNLTKQAVADSLLPHVGTFFNAIDSILAKKTDVYAKLMTAADVMPAEANVLAGAISKQYPDKFNGSADSSAASLRAALTSLLQEHVFLAGIAINTAVTTGLSSASTKAAVQTLDVNTVNLSNAIDSVYAGAGKTFLPLWRKHIGFFVSYTVAGAKGDKAGQAKAKTALDGYRADFGAFLAAANPNLTKQAVADSLLPHVGTFFNAIDSILAKKTDVYAKLMTAADVMPAEANVLAGAISKQYPDKFTV